MRSRSTLCLVLLCSSFGLPLAAGTFEFCSDPALTIAGADPLTDIIDVPDSLVIDGVEVFIDISHTYIGDLLLVLISPDGAFLQLFEPDGGKDEDDLLVTFSDDGAAYDSEAWTCDCLVAPIGPGALADFADGTSDGSWLLLIVDVFPMEDDGTLNTWCLTLDTCGDLLPITDLSCEVADDDVTLLFKNPGGWDSFEVEQDGDAVDTIPGDADTTYFAEDLPAGVHNFQVVATSDTLGCDGRSNLCVSQIGGSETCLSPPAAIAIPSLEVTVSTLEIVEEVALTELMVSVEITHAFIGDLDLVLESPDAVTATLYMGGGGAQADMALSFSDNGLPHGSELFTCGCIMEPAGPGALADLVGKSGLGTWTLTIEDFDMLDDGTLDDWCITQFGDEAPPPPPGPFFLRGDASGNGSFSALLDALFLLSYFFLSGDEPPCLEAADADGNGTVNGLLDALYMLVFTFSDGPAPPSPFPECGTATLAVGCETSLDCP